jgi:hypothetical protein
MLDTEGSEVHTSELEQPLKAEVMPARIHEKIISAIASIRDMSSPLAVGTASTGGKSERKPSACMTKC